MGSEFVLVWAQAACRFGHGLAVKKRRRFTDLLLILPNSQLFTYGTYSFHIMSVKVMNGDDGTILSTALPKELVLGLFTWDDTEKL